MENLQRISVPLRGIIKDKPQLQSADGDCEELINLRFIDNAWRGVGAKTLIEFSIVTPDIYSPIIHPDMVDNNMFIGYCPATGNVSLITANDNDASTITVIHTLAGGDTFRSFAWMNNTLIVYTDNRVVVLQFVDDAFVYLPDLNDRSIPAPRIAVGEEVEGLTEYKLISSDWVEAATSNYITQELFDIIYTDFITKFSTNQDLGFMIGYMSFMFAFKLYDGNYILHQGVFPLNLDVDRPKIESQAGKSFPQWRVTARVTKPAIYYFFNQEIRNTIKTWKDAGLIQEFSIFMSNPINPYNIYETDVSKWVDRFAPQDFTQVDKIVEAINFYKIGEIAIPDILSSALDEPGKHVVTLDKGQIQSIETLEVLPVDTFTHHDLIPQETYKFNSRLHLGNITTIPGKIPWPFLDWFDSATGDPDLGGFGFRPRCDEVISLGYMTGYMEQGKGIFTNADYKLHIAVTIDVEGKKIVSIREMTTSQLRLWGDGVYLHAMASYPDARATKLQVLISYTGDTGSPRVIKSIDLVKHPFHNIAYCKPTNDFYWYRPIWVQFPVNNGGYLLLPEWNNTHDLIFVEPNRIQVSEVNNAFFYPAKQSYRIGNTDHTIRAMIVAQEPLTEMQFGQFPLYCFTAGGVHALEYAGGGEVLYSRITQFLTDVIREGAIPVALAGGAIVYQELSAVKVLIGREAKDISRPVIVNSKNPIYLDAHLVNMTDNPELSELRAVLDDPASTMQMDDFILNSLIGYDHTRKEILFTGNGNYTLVYQLISGAWYKRTDMFDNYLHETGGHLGMVREVAGVTDVDIPKYGLLYNWFAATDVRNICAEGWEVPSVAQIITFSTYLGGDSVAGGKIKEIGLTYWNSPNTGATNEVYFNGRGNGIRLNSDGTFYGLKSTGYMRLSDARGTMFMLNAINDDIQYSVTKQDGAAIRPIKTTTTLTHGQTGTYTGNDGKVYRTICIGTQEWLADNLAETKYRNGDAIPEVTDNKAWAALETGALCAYDNDWSNAFTTEEETTFRTSFYKLSSEVETAEGEQSIMQKPWIFAQTRPFSLGQLSYKHIERIIARFMGVNFVVREIDHIEVEARYGALYNQWALIDAAEPEPALELTFDDIANVPVADASDVADWNTFFDLPTNGTPFTSVDVDVNMVRLSGGGNIFINGSIFYGNENPLISIVDNSGVITSVSDFCFASNCNITLIKLKALITAGISSFIECKILKELRLDALDSCGVACFGQLYDLETLYIPVVSDLGGTTGDDTVFFGLYTGENTNNITITVPAALMTCNGGNPDGDIQWLIDNNTVTIITV